MRLNALFKTCLLEQEDGWQLSILRRFCGSPAIIIAVGGGKSVLVGHSHSSEGIGPNRNLLETNERAGKENGFEFASDPTKVDREMEHRCQHWTFESDQVCFDSVPCGQTGTWTAVSCR